MPRPSLTTDALLGLEIGGRFVITRPLGEGETARIYAARDHTTNRRVAIKILHPTLAEIPAAKQRFLREHEAGCKLHHPNLVEIYQAGALEDGRPYFAMELLEGRTLGEMLKEGPVPPTRALGIAAQVARALEAAHSAGIIHRDVNPENIVVTRGDVVKLCDFGIALQETSERMTLTGMRLGNPIYTSPEAANGEIVGKPADVYGLGVVLYHALCGHPPFMGASLKVLAAHVSQKPPRLVGEVGGLPVSLDTLMSRLLAKDPATRPTAAQAAVELESAAADMESSDVRPSSATATPHPRELILGISQAVSLPTAPEPEPPGPPAWKSGTIALAAGGTILAAAVVIAVGVLLLGSLASRPAAPPLAVRDAGANAWYDPSLDLSDALVTRLDDLQEAIGFARRGEPWACAAVESTVTTAPALAKELATKADPALRPALREVSSSLAAIDLDVPADDAPPAPPAVRIAWSELADAAGKPMSEPIVTWAAFATAAHPWDSTGCIDPSRAEPWFVRLATAPGPACLDGMLAPSAAVAVDALTAAPCWCGGDPARTRIGVRRLGQLAAQVEGLADAGKALEARADAKDLKIEACGG